MMDAEITNDLKDAGEELALQDMPARNKYIATAVLAVIALLSIFLLAGIFSSPETYSGTIDSLDKKKDTVLTLTAVSAGASAALSAIPDDTCTPLAERMADLSGDFLIILTAIYLEKYLLTTFGFATFALLVPISCVLVIAALFMRSRPGLRRPFIRLAEKLALLGIALVLTVPASVFVADRIEATYQDSINATIAAAEITEAAAEDTNEQVQRNEATNPIEFFQQRIEDIQNAAGGVASTVSGAVEWVQGVISNFTEAVAVMIVVSCIIPILVLLFFLWVVKLILGVNVDVPIAILKPGALGRMGRKA